MTLSKALAQASTLWPFKGKALRHHHSPLGRQGLVGCHQSRAVPYKGSAAGLTCVLLFLMTKGQAEDNRKGSPLFAITKDKCLHAINVQVKHRSPLELYNLITSILMEKQGQLNSSTTSGTTSTGIAKENSTWSARTHLSIKPLVMLLTSPPGLQKTLFIPKHKKCPLHNTKNPKKYCRLLLKPRKSSQTQIPLNPPTRGNKSIQK
jgi:hypothetical protein